MTDFPLISLYTQHSCWYYALDSDSVAIPLIKKNESKRKFRVMFPQGLNLLRNDT